MNSSQNRSSSEPSQSLDTPTEIGIDFNSKRISTIEEDTGPIWTVKDTKINVKQKQKQKQSQGQGQGQGQDQSQTQNERLGGRDFEENATLKALGLEMDNIRNRLLSIEYDTLRMMQLYLDLTKKEKKLPLFGNARAGSWYVPAEVGGERTLTCSFKSNDGHYGKWASSIRRPNLHVLESVLGAEETNGMIIVDVTRSGKRIPDSLSKTIPIWCSVISSLINDTNENEIFLHASVSENEQEMIRSLLPKWVSEWRKNNMHNHELIVRARKKLQQAQRKKCIRCLWINPSSLTWDEGIPFDSFDFIPVICVSASINDNTNNKDNQNKRQLVENSLETTNVNNMEFPSRFSFAYIQGAGDDEENWSFGLRAEEFWRHREELLGGLKNSVVHDNEIIKKNIKRIRELKCDEDISGRKTPSSITNIWSTNVSVCHQLNNNSSDNYLEGIQTQNQKHSSQRFKLIIALGFQNKEQNDKNDKNGKNENIHDPKIEYISLTDYKGKLEYKYAFGRSLGKCLSLLRTYCVDHDERVLIACSSRHGDWTSGLVIAWLLWHCELSGGDDDDEGDIKYRLNSEGCELSMISKQQVHRTMMHFLSSFPSFELSRPTLKQLNRFFSSPFPSSTISN